MGDEFLVSVHPVKKESPLVRDSTQRVEVVADGCDFTFDCLACGLRDFGHGGLVVWLEVQLFLG